jgi:Ca2+-binding RTX toxin-like protein
MCGSYTGSTEWNKRDNIGSDDMYGDNPDSSAAASLTGGDDKLFGHRGQEFLIGFGGSNLLRGGHQADGINAQEFSLNPGEDTVMGNAGRDSIDAEVVPKTLTRTPRS